MGLTWDARVQVMPALGYLSPVVALANGNPALVADGREPPTLDAPKTGTCLNRTLFGERSSDERIRFLSGFDRLRNRPYLGELFKPAFQPLSADSVNVPGSLRLDHVFLIASICDGGIYILLEPSEPQGGLSS